MKELQAKAKEKYTAAQEKRAEEAIAAGRQPGVSGHSRGVGSDRWCSNRRYPSWDLRIDTLREHAWE